MDEKQTNKKLAACGNNHHTIKEACASSIKYNVSFRLLVCRKKKESEPKKKRDNDVNCSLRSTFLQVCGIFFSRYFFS